MRFSLSIYTRASLHPLPSSQHQPQYLFPLTRTILSLIPLSFSQIPFSSLNSETPISTTSPMPAPPSHSTCYTRLNISPYLLPHPLLYPPRPLLPLLIPDHPTQPPSETLKDIRNFLNMTQENALLPHPPFNLSFPIRSIFLRHINTLHLM